MAHALYERYPSFSEGRLAKIRSQVVSRRACAAVAAQLGLGDKLREQGALPPEELERLAENRNVLAALIEAALAALFLEHGFEPIERPIVEAFSDQIDYAASHDIDYKTELQEALARRRSQVSYAVVSVEGPPHDRRFTCVALVEGRELGTGSGRTKKEAEQAAARQALAALQEDGQVGSGG